jgi:protein TonB
MTADGLDDDTSRRYRYMPASGALVSSVLHAGVALALLPEMLPQQARLTEREITVTLELPMPNNERSALSAPSQAARNLPPGIMESAPEPTAPARGPIDAANAPTPVPPEPDIALIVPSAEPPPSVQSREIGAASSPPASTPNLEKFLPPVTAPPLVSGRDFAVTAPHALASSPSLQPRPQALPPPQPVHQATPRRASHQQTNDGTDRYAGQVASPLATAAVDDRVRQVRQDYIALIVRRLSGARFYEQSREENAQGLVVARLTIGQDGRLLALTLARSSGFPGRDRSVAEAIRRAAPFPALPPEITGEPYTFMVPIGYELER